MTHNPRPSLLSLLRVKLRYTYLRDGQIYYQRHVPKDLAGRFPQSIIKVPLGTADPLKAVRLVKALNLKHERQWELLRADPSVSSAAAEAQALVLLRQYGLTPHSSANDEALLGAFTEPFDAARAAYAGECDDTWRNADPSEYLSPVQSAALDLLKPKQDKLLDALGVYLGSHVNGDSEDRKDYAAGAIACFTAAMGDKSLVDIRRADVRAFIDHERARGSKTATVRRRLNELRAVFAKYVLEKELPATTRNPFAEHAIKGEGRDVEEGSPLSNDDWSKVAKLCRERDDPIRWMIAIQMTTGARIAEVAGLALDQIVLDATVPYVVFTKNDARGIKTDRPSHNGTPPKWSYRAVPLVGVGLWAAGRVKAAADAGQTYAFDLYIGEDGKLKADSASATVNKWIKGRGLGHTSHDFRHTLRDRLRNTGCPEEAALEIGGWAKEFVGSKSYGDGHLLSIRQKHLLAAVGES
jgi:integrase